MARRQKLLIRLISVAAHAAALSAAAFLWPAPDASEAQLLSAPGPGGPIEFTPHAPEPVLCENGHVDPAPLLATMPEEAYEPAHLPPDLAEASFTGAELPPENVPAVPAVPAAPPRARVEVLCLATAPRPVRFTPRRTQFRRLPAAPAPPRAGTRRDARVRRLPEPEYPASCRREGHEGSVSIEVEVYPSGRSGRLRVARCTGCERLIAAAMEAARRATFSPATRGGRPVTSRLIVIYRFRIR